MKRFSFTARATEDLREIGRYTRKNWGADQAKRYRAELLLTATKLSLNSAIGRSREELSVGIRSFGLGVHIAYYVVHEDGISIVRLLHPSMDIERAFGSR